MIEFYSNLTFILVSIILAIGVYVTFISYRVFGSLAITASLIIVIIGSGTISINLIEKIKSLPLIQIEDEVIVIDGIASKDYIFYWVIQEGILYPQTLAMPNTEQNKNQLQNMLSKKGKKGNPRVLFSGKRISNNERFVIEPLKEPKHEGKNDQ